MRYESKRWHRENNFFINQNGMHDLTKVAVLHSGVDTVKELYKCLLKKDVLEDIKNCHEGDFDPVYTIADLDFLVSRGSKSSGYGWILRNNQLGLVVLLKSFYAEEGLHASHIKIEGSPHLINNLTPQDYSDMTLFIAGLFADQIHCSGVAAHLAVDVKGWVPPDDFEYRLVTRAKRKVRFNAKSEVSFDLNEIATIHGERQTFTFGSASSIQMCVYDKVAEAQKTDKIHYWENQWSKIMHSENFLEPEYKRGDKVTRIEGRLHHTVIQQFCYGTKDKDGKNIEINNFADLSEHLTALWRYFLNNFRLQHSTCYIDPFWQILDDDIEFFKPAPDLVYKRGKKPPSDVTRRTIAIWIGNVIRMHARKNIKIDITVKHILSGCVNEDIMDYLGLFGWEGREVLYDVLHDFVTKKNQKHILQGIAA